MINLDCKYRCPHHHKSQKLIFFIKSNLSNLFLELEYEFRRPKPRFIGLNEGNFENYGLENAGKFIFEKNFEKNKIS